MSVSGATRGAGGYGLGNHLADVKEHNEKTTLGESRGLVTTDIAAQVAELTDLVCHARTKKPLYHVHVDPSSDWSDEAWKRYWDRFESEFGLDRQAFTESVHEKNSRLHKHRVYSLVRPDGTAIKMSHDYARREKLGRLAEIENGEELNLGRHNRAAVRQLVAEGREDVAEAIVRAGLDTAERPEAPLSPAERAQQERTGIRREDVGRAALAAWNGAKNSVEFHAALAYAGLKLARGKSVVGVVDAKNGFHPLRRLLSQAAQQAGGKSVRAKEIDALLDDIVLPKHDPDAEKTVFTLREQVDLEPPLPPDPSVAPVNMGETVDLSFLEAPDWADPEDRKRYLSQLAAAEALRKEAVRVAALETNPEALTAIQQRFGMGQANELARRMLEKKISLHDLPAPIIEEKENDDVPVRQDAGTEGGQTDSNTSGEVLGYVDFNAPRPPVLRANGKSRPKIPAAPAPGGLDGGPVAPARGGDSPGRANPGEAGQKGQPRNAGDHVRNADNREKSGRPEGPARNAPERSGAGRPNVGSPGANPEKPSGTVRQGGFTPVGTQNALKLVGQIRFFGAIQQQSPRISRLSSLSEMLMAPLERAYARLGRAEIRVGNVLEQKPWSGRDDLNPQAVARRMEVEATAKYDLAVEDAEKMQQKVDEARANAGWRRLFNPETRSGFRRLQKTADEAATEAFRLRVVPGQFDELAKTTVAQRRLEQRRWVERPDVQAALKESGELERVRTEIDAGNEQVIEAAADGDLFLARKLSTEPQSPRMQPQVDHRREFRL